MLEDYLKIIETIESCKTLEHFTVAKKMITNFKKKHSHEQTDKYFEDFIYPRVIELRVFLKDRRVKANGL